MADDSEGRVAYEKAKEELVKALAKKRQIDRTLAQLEVQIHNMEGAYLNETAGHGGNIVVGFEHYLKATAPTKKRVEVNESDRMFSNSSSTYTKSIDLLEADESDTESKLGGGSVNGLVTVSLTPATRNQELSAGQLKRERDREYQRKKRAMNSKRAPSVMSIDEEAVVPKRTTKRQRMQDEGMSVD